MSRRAVENLITPKLLKALAEAGYTLVPIQRPPDLLTVARGFCCDVPCENEAKGYGCAAHRFYRSAREAIEKWTPDP